MSCAWTQVRLEPTTPRYRVEHSTTEPLRFSSFDAANIKSLTVDECMKISTTNVRPAKSDSDVMFCLQSYQELRIDTLLVY